MLALPKRYQRTCGQPTSPLHLLAIMYAAFRQIDPTLDSGADFSREYEMALTFAK